MTTAPWWLTELEAERALADAAADIFDRATAGRKGVVLILGRRDVEAWLARHREARQ